MTNRNVYLDYLGFFAIFLVFAHHFFGRFSFNEYDLFASFSAIYGKLVVDIFFPLIEFFKVLSGYVDSFFALNYYLYFAISFASSYLFCKLLFTRVESRFIEFSRLGVFVNRNKKT